MAGKTAGGYRIAAVTGDKVLVFQTVALSTKVVLFLRQQGGSIAAVGLVAGVAAVVEGLVAERPVELLPVMAAVAQLFFRQAEQGGLPGVVGFVAGLATTFSHWLMAVVLLPESRCQLLVAAKTQVRLRGQQVDAAHQAVGAVTAVAVFLPDRLVHDSLGE